MKKFILFSILFFTFSVNAQISVTNVDFPAGGDSVWYSTASANGIDFLTTGPNTTWDYSALTPTGNSVYYHRGPNLMSGLASINFGSFAPTKYKATFFIESDALPIAQVSQLLQLPIDNLFEFTKVSPDSVTALGYSFSASGQLISFRSDTIEKKYNLPFTYQDAWAGRGYTDIDLNPVFDAIWRQKRQRISEVDGWGSITTPYGTYNVVRVKHEIKEQDSIRLTLPVIGQTWVPINLPTSYEYEFWANGEDIPILKITTTSLAGNETAIAVEYKDIPALGVEDLALENIQLYPNPAQTVITISGLKQGSTIEITDVNGRLIQSIAKTSNPAESIETSQFGKGIYFVKVMLDNQVKSLIFVKE